MILYDLKGKKVVIFGAGPVGRIAAILAAKLKCKTYLAETWEKSSEQFIKKLVKELMEEAGETTTEIVCIDENVYFTLLETSLNKRNCFLKYF